MMKRQILPIVTASEFLHVQDYTIKSNLHYTRGIMPKRVTRKESYLCDIAPGQHSSEERRKSQRWRVFDDTASDLSDPRTNSNVFDSCSGFGQISGKNKSQDVSLH